MAFTKIIQSGQIVDVYTYEHLNTNAEPPLQTKEAYGNGKNKLEQYAKTVRRRMRDIRNLANTNFEQDKSKFITLTFRENLTDVEVANHELKKFIMKLKRRHDDFKYLWVIEFQERGAVHYHMICNLPFVQKAELEKLWTNGFVKINRINNVDNVGAYVTSYMSKDIDDARLQTKKAFGYSQDLIRPLEINDWSHEQAHIKQVGRIQNEMFIALQEGKKKVYHAEYTTEHCGKITHTQYKPNLDS